MKNNGKCVKVSSNICVFLHIRIIYIRIPNEIIYYSLYKMKTSNKGMAEGI